MDEKFLESLGISATLAVQILAENTKDVETERTKATETAGKLTAAEGTIKQLQETVRKYDGVDVDKLKQDVTDLQEKYKTDTAQLRLDHALDRAIAESHAKDPKFVRAGLDLSNVKLEGDQLTGLTEQLTTLKTSAPYLFEADGFTGKEPTAGATPPAAAPTTLSGAVAEAMAAQLGK